MGMTNSSMNSFSSMNSLGNMASTGMGMNSLMNAGNSMGSMVNMAQNQQQQSQKRKSEVGQIRKSVVICIIDGRQVNTWISITYRRNEWEAFQLCYLLPDN